MTDEPQQRGHLTPTHLSKHTAWWRQTTRVMRTNRSQHTCPLVCGVSGVAQEKLHVENDEVNKVLCVRIRLGCVCPRREGRREGGRRNGLWIEEEEEEEEEEDALWWTKIALNNRRRKRKRTGICDVTESRQSGLGPSGPPHVPKKEGHGTHAGVGSAAMPDSSVVLPESVRPPSAGREPLSTQSGPDPSPRSTSVNSLWLAQWPLSPWGSSVTGSRKLRTRRPSEKASPWKPWLLEDVVETLELLQEFARGWSSPAEEQGRVRVSFRTHSARHVDSQIQVIAGVPLPCGVRRTHPRPMPRTVATEYSPPFRLCFWRHSRRCSQSDHSAAHAKHSQPQRQTLGGVDGSDRGEDSQAAVCCRDSRFLATDRRGLRAPTGTAPAVITAIRRIHFTPVGNVSKLFHSQQHALKRRRRGDKPCCFTFDKLYTLYPRRHLDLKIIPTMHPITSSDTRYHVYIVLCTAVTSQCQAVTSGVKFRSQITNR
ncbi:hypothetical protein E2C01_018958 [Portunus trituberculatus]|uniref:Uncharacterized protein n=1 Tax=Portunus trituberculatus TaxID=210409 RepID=A0A5B7DX05_PORTR|nr:hypothetical protein [Portunus trituberculatus]